MFHVKHEAWVRDAEELGLSLSDKQVGQLATYLQLLQRIAVPRGMIAVSDRERLWERHLLDGLRGVPELPPGAAADLGSGAGIPGIPLAIAAPATSVTLIEPRRARASFLEAVIDEAGLRNARVELAKAQDVAGQFQACVARAFGSPAATWDAAQPLLEAGGVVLYWAGATFELADLDDLGIKARLSTHSDLAPTGPLVIMGPR
jgi:16S rRNA (guanine527-N7)-methyltransferase